MIWAVGGENNGVTIATIGQGLQKEEFGLKRRWKNKIQQFLMLCVIVPNMKAKNPDAQYRAHTYRIYPSEHQIKKLLEWESANRFLWNLANEERKQPWRRSKADRDKVFHKERVNQDTKFECNFYTQSASLTELRKQYQWLKLIPQALQSALLKKLDISWQRWFKIPNTGMPRFKKKSNKFDSIKCLDIRGFSIKNNEFFFTKLGKMPIIIDTLMIGVAKTCSISKDVDQWFVHVVYEEQKPQPLELVGPKEVIGIDRGITNKITDSKESLQKEITLSDHQKKKLKRLERKVLRQGKTKNCKKKNLKKTRDQIAKIHRQDRRRRSHNTHELSKKYAKSQGVIVLEKLNTAGMSKVGCQLGNRINRSCWSLFKTQLLQKAARFGATVIEVNAKYTSQTCFSCGSIDKKNRNGEQFLCTKCGHSDHADVNAAKNIRARGIATLSNLLPQV